MISFYAVRISEHEKSNVTFGHSKCQATLNNIDQASIFLSSIPLAARIISRRGHGFQSLQTGGDELNFGTPRHKWFIHYCTLGRYLSIELEFKHTCKAVSKVQF